MAAPSWPHDADFFVNYALTEERAILRDSVRSFLTAHHDAARCRAFRTTKHGFDQPFWSQMAEMGWLSLRLPEDLQGLGLSVAEAVVVARELGERAVADPFVVASLMPSVVLAAAGRSDLSVSLAAGLASGQLTLAMMVGDARLHIEAGKLSGDIQVYSIASGCRLCLQATYEGRPAILVIEIDRAGVSQRVLARMDGSAGAAVSLRGVSFTAADLLVVGEGAAAAWRRAHSEGLIAVSAQLTGLSSALLKNTVTYLRQRVQFGQPLINFQVIQHKLVELAILTRLAESSYRRALRAYLESPDGAHDALHAAKARCSDAASEMARAAVQLHGAIGYTDDCEVAGYFRSALTLSQLMGNSAWHRAQLWSHQPASATAPQTERGRVDG